MNPKLSFWLILTGGLLALPAETSAARTNPVPVETIAPTYPADLVDTGRSGGAVIAMTITAEGRVSEPVVQSSDHPAFGHAALAAVRGWRFEPARQDGTAVAIKVALPFQFRAPLDQQFNAKLGRKAYRPLPPDITVLAAADYGSRLQLLTSVPPALLLPQALKGQEFTDVLQVQCIVTPEGLVINPELEEPPPTPELGGPALMAAAMARFAPPRKDGQPVYVRVTLPLDFRAKPPKAENPFLDLSAHQYETPHAPPPGEGEPVVPGRGY